MITILAFIFVFGLIVFVHELGHFLAAKRLGVGVRTFAFGFPPRIWSKKVGNTIYAVNAIPLGGYVTLKGEEGIPDKNGSVVADSDSLLAKKPWELMIIYAAGVIMNFFLAVLLLYICYLVGFQPIAPGMADYPGVTSTQHVVVTQVEKNAPAEKQGIKAGDTIVSINGSRIQTTNDMVVDITKAGNKGNDTVKVDVKRGNNVLEKQITTYKSKVNGTEITRIGVDIADKGVVQGNVASSLYAAFLEVFHLLWLTLLGVLSLFVQLITSFTISNQITGPVGIVVATSYFANLGFISLLQFAAVLSLSLAVFNVLPIPALDGGHLLFSLIELIGKRRISQQVKNSAALIGFSLLILLIIAVTVKDFFTFDIIGMLKGIF